MFYTLNQNNSGGYLIQNDNVDRFVIVEANNAKEAQEIFKNILDDYREYCECCGERWSDDWLDEGDADNEPYIYDKPIKIFNDEYWCRGASAIVYYLDGRKLKLNLETREETWL